MLKLKLSNGQEREVAKGSNLLALAQELQGEYASPIVEAVFNGEGIDLQRPLQTDGTVSFIEVNTPEGMRVYVRTLLFMLLAATKMLSTRWQARAFSLSRVL